MCVSRLQSPEEGYHIKQLGTDFAGVLQKAAEPELGHVSDRVGAGIEPGASGRAVNDLTH